MSNTEPDNSEIVDHGTEGARTSAVVTGGDHDQVTTNPDPVSPAPSVPSEEAGRTSGNGRGISYHYDFEQGSGDWAKMRTGLLTASEMHLILTPTLKVAASEKERQHLYELLAQRMTGHVEPHFTSFAMERGKMEEVAARDLYAREYQPVVECGFVTNDIHGFTLGYSPDGLVGTDGLIEAKSRAQKYQVQTIIDGAMPSEYMLQVQSGLLITQRKWCDFLSYSGGLPMFMVRVFPDLKVHNAILEAAGAFEHRLRVAMRDYQENSAKFFATPRVDYSEITA